MRFYAQLVILATLLVGANTVTPILPLFGHSDSFKRPTVFSAPVKMFNHALSRVYTSDYEVKVCVFGVSKTYR
jgi:hypothetical protein